MTTANNYLMANGQAMVDAKVLSADFVQRFKDAGTDFDTAKSCQLDADLDRRHQHGGPAGVEKIKLQLGLMQGFGKQAFRYEPDLLKLFTEDYLLDAVRSKHPAGLDGTTALPPADGITKGKPLADILVESVGVEANRPLRRRMAAISSKQLAAGEHLVRYSGEGIATVAKKVVLEPGVSRRVDVTLEPAPVVVAAEERTVQAPAATTTLSNAVSELLVDVPKATNGVHAGAAA